MNAQCSETGVWRWDGNKPADSQTDQLAREEPLEIRIRGRGVAVTMRTPGHDEELTAGFLFTEGLIQKREDVSGIAHCRQGKVEHYENTINAFLGPSIAPDLDRFIHNRFTSSSCGVCGKASIESIHQLFPPIASNLTIAPTTLLEFPQKLRAEQRVFDLTGGLHAAAIFTEKGELECAREDIGRHNAVDKIIGHGFLGGNLPFDRHVMVVSGRLSFEIVQKALAARIPIIAAISAPSSLAAEFAKDNGQTLIGFLRNGSFKVYSHPHRVRTAD